MNRTRLLIGGLLAGAVGPVLGIWGNSDHAWGKIIAAVCFSLVGCGLILREILVRKTKP